MTHAHVVVIEAPPLSQAVGAAMPAEAVISMPDAAHALAHLAGAAPAALIIDLPPAECLAALRTLSVDPALNLLVHARGDDDEGFIVQAVQAGAAGFITHPAQVAAALQALQEGAPYLPPELAGALVRGLQMT